MNYIVLDLEWNQPTSYQSSAYRKIGDTMLFEVLQFGAAKISPEMKLLDTISIPVAPTYYLTVHPRVRRMTGITQEMLCDADSFPTALERFLEWCGEDFVFVTWGCDDVSVLKQNIDCFKLPTELPPMYDLQGLYAREQGKSGQTALKTAMEELHISEEAERPFHNAMHDAYYTALVFAGIKNAADVLEFETKPRKYTHTERASRLKVTDMVASVEEGVKGLRNTKCPTCGKEMRAISEIVPQAPGKYVALCKCDAHGVMFLKARFMLLEEGRKGVNLTVTPATRHISAYVHTKELQYHIKRKRGDYAGVDMEDLSGVPTNMPFEDL